MTSSSSPRSRTPSSTTSVPPKPCARSWTARCRLRARPLRGPRAAPAPGAHARGTGAIRRAERRGRAGAPPGRPRLRQPRAARWPGRRGERARATPSRHTARSSSTRCAGTRSCRRGGGRRSRGPRRSSSAPSTSARSSRRSSVTSSASTRCRRESTSRSSAPGRATRRSRGSSRRRAATRRTRGTPTSESRTRATPSGSPRSSQASEPTVLYFGKLLYNKGVHLLLEALRELDARAVIVGFGDYREELEALAGPDTLFTGALEHRHLVQLLPLADVSVVPSIFPEAFGMVAAEAAAAGSPPLVARHSGLREIAEGLEAEYPPEYRHLASFAKGDAATSARGCASCWPCPTASTGPSPRRRVRPRSRAGAGRASRIACSNPSNTPIRRRPTRLPRESLM